MTTVPLSRYFELFPPIDACAVDDTRCMVLISSSADPQLPRRDSALVLVDHATKRASVLAEFPGASALILWLDPRKAERGLPALVTSPGGRMWKVSADGAVEQIDSPLGDSGPALYGYLNCTVDRDGFTYVGGMGNQLYRSARGRVAFERQDDGILDTEMIDDDAAIYGLAALSGGSLVAVGGGGMILDIGDHGIRRIDSGTNAMINAVCALDAQRFLACGTAGVLLRGSIEGWCETAATPGASYFSDVRVQHDRALWLGGRVLFASSLDDGWAELAPVPGAPAVSRFARGGAVTWAIDPANLGRSADGRHWDWLPTSSITVEV
jgi:hypothetical protein